uniref:Uncharacterized protein n=1 Tax=viral metagenome TaxID=1070528 RepID=A0A6C0KHX0_9ZZZZ
MAIIVNSTNTQFFLSGVTSIQVNGVVSTSPVTYANYIGQAIVIKDVSANILATIVVSPDGKFSVDLENTVVVKKDFAFYGCTNLTSIVIPSNTLTIGNGMFYGCTNLENMDIPASVTTIGNDMFHGCRALTSVSMLKGITTIGNDMFHDCIALESVTIPSSVTMMGYNMFYGCVGLLSATILANIGVIDHDTFRNCSALQTMFIPNSVTTIGDDAFSGCSSLNTILLPPGMTTLGNGVFSGCSSLNGIILPENITAIGAGAFEDCRELTRVSIPPNMRTIGNNMFAGCSLLETVTIPSGVVAIGDFAFIDCIALTELILPMGITRIANNMCYNCVSLTRVTIPSTVVTIGNAAFFNCSKLDELVIPEGVTFIGNYAFHGCSAMKQITVPSSVTTIGCNVFQFCTSLINVNMLANITSIENSLFYGCRSLVTVNIPESVITLGNFVFCECSLLKAIAIPQNVVSIGDFAFEFSGVESIVVDNNNTSLASIDGILYNKALTTLLCYPPRKIGDTYSVPSTVTRIARAGISGCIALKNILSNSASFSSVNGVLYSADLTTLLFYPAGKTDNAFAMPSAVTTIQSDCFVDCLFSSIHVGANVTKIHSWFLQKCNHVTTVTIPSAAAFKNTYSVDSKSPIFYANSKLDSLLFVGDYVANSEIQLFDNVTIQKVYYLAKNPTWNGITSYMGLATQGITDATYDVIGNYTKFLEYRESLIAYKDTLTNLLVTSNAKYKKAKSYMREYDTIVYLFYKANEAATAYDTVYNAAYGAAYGAAYNAAFGKTTNTAAAAAAAVTAAAAGLDYDAAYDAAFDAAAAGAADAAAAVAVADLAVNAIYNTSYRSTLIAAKANTTAANNAIKPYLTTTEQANITPAIRNNYYQYYSSMYSKAKTLAATYVIAIADTQSTIDKIATKLGDTAVLQLLEELGVNLNHIPQYTVNIPDINAFEQQTISKITTLHDLTISKVVNSTKTTYTGVYNDFMSVFNLMKFDTKTV